VLEELSDFAILETFKLMFSDMAILRVGGPYNASPCQADCDVADRQPGGLRTEVRLQSSSRAPPLSRNRFRKSFEGKFGTRKTLKLKRLFLALHPRSRFEISARQITTDLIII
jgi:hypothetical protein